MNLSHSKSGGQSGRAMLLFYMCKNMSMEVLPGLPFPPFSSTYNAGGKLLTPLKRMNIQGIFPTPRAGDFESNKKHGVSSRALDIPAISPGYLPFREGV